MQGIDAYRLWSLINTETIIIGVLMKLAEIHVYCRKKNLPVWRISMAIIWTVQSNWEAVQVTIYFFKPSYKPSYY